MATAEIQLRRPPLTHPRDAYGERDVIDNLQRSIIRWGGHTSPTTFTESVHDHAEGMFLWLQAINEHSPTLASEIDLQHVAAYLYLHDFKEIGAGDFTRRGDERYEIERAAHKTLEDQAFESHFKHFLPPEAREIIYAYDDPNNVSREVLFARALDKAHSCITGLNHFYNPRRFGTGKTNEQISTYRKAIAAMLEPLTILRDQISPDAQQELKQLVDIVMNRFTKAGYEELVEEFNF